VAPAQSQFASTAARAFATSVRSGSEAGSQAATASEEPTVKSPSIIANRIIAASSGAVRSS
jgi:hypothetical protein